MQIALAVLILADHGIGLGLMSYVTPMTLLTGATTVLSAVLYLITWLRYMASYDIEGCDKRPRQQSEGKH
jgi:hypothetical protein